MFRPKERKEREKNTKNKGDKHKAISKQLTKT